MSSAVNLCCLHQFAFIFLIFFVKEGSSTHHRGSMLRAGKAVACSVVDQVQNLAESFLADRLACTDTIRICTILRNYCYNTVSVSLRSTVSLWYPYCNALTHTETLLSAKRFFYP